MPAGPPVKVFLQATIEVINAVTGEVEEKRVVVAAARTMKWRGHMTVFLRDVKDATREMWDRAGGKLP